MQKLWPSNGEIIMKCNCCGKFRKKDHLVGMSGDSDDCGNYESWLECIHCMSQDDFERYFKGEQEIIELRNNQ